MIPTLILYGLVCGRWWRFALASAAAGWPLLLLATGTIGSAGEFAGAGALAVANTAAGVLPHQAALWAYRRLRGAAPAGGR